MALLPPAVLIAPAWLDGAQAAEISLASNTRTPLITIDGNIESGDEAKFRAIADKLGKATVLLYGNGGKTAPAIEIGRMIKAKGMGTAVANGFDCANACGLIWLAGTPRFLAKTSRVGIPSNVDRNSSDPLASYVTLLNLPEKTQAFTTTVDSKSTAWVTTENAAEAGIDVAQLGPAAPPSAPAATAAATPPAPPKPATAAAAPATPAAPPKPTTVAATPATPATPAATSKPAPAAVLVATAATTPPKPAPAAPAAVATAPPKPAPAAAATPAASAAVTPPKPAIAAPPAVAAPARPAPLASTAPPAIAAAPATASVKPVAAVSPTAAATPVAAAKPLAAVTAPAAVASPMATAATAGTAAPAAKPVVADTPFATTGAWEIRRGDASVGGGCYAMTSYEPDIVLIVGYDLAQKSVFLNIGSARLQPIDPAKSYAMQVRFDNHKPWDARAEVGFSNKVKFMMMTFRAGEFMNEFMNANGMTLREPGKDNDKDVLKLNLPRSGAAGREMLRCQGGSNPLAVSGEVASARTASAAKTR